jgi:hypothetical protein
LKDSIKTFIYIVAVSFLSAIFIVLIRSTARTLRINGNGCVRSLINFLSITPRVDGKIGGETVLPLKALDR